MPNLDLKLESIKKEVKVDLEGVVTFSISATARIVGVGRSTLIEAFSADRANKGLKQHPLALILIARGFNVIGFASNGVPDLAVSIIADYYAFEVEEKYRKNEAVIACRVFSAIGVRKWGQDLLGWKPPTQSSNDQVLLLLGEMRTEMNNMREEITAQNSRVNLMLPSYQMMQKIKPALSLADGKVQALMEKISQNLEDFPNQEYLPIRYFLRDLRCTRGETISIGKAVNGFFKGFTGKELPTKYAYKNSHKLYPECAKPVFEYVLESNKR